MNGSEMYHIGLQALLGAMSEEDWTTRRAKFEHWRGLPSSSTSDPYPAAPRPMEDEFGWYVFIGEDAVNDPFALDPDQAARVLPILAGLADRWQYASRVEGIEQKLSELAGSRRSAPDNGLFEISVALAYAASGHNVKIIPEQPGIQRTPDLRVSINGIDLYVECKRQSAHGAYEQMERMHWRRLWSPLETLLVEARVPVWLKVEFRHELSTYCTTYLADRLKFGLRLVTAEIVLIDDEFLKVEAKPVDTNAVRAHLRNVYVKVRGTQERALLGGSWAPARAKMESVCSGKRMQPSSKIPAWKARSFWDQINWGSGITWSCTAEDAIERKARDIKNLFSRAIEQLPLDKPGIVHIAAETLAGNDVEVRRTQKIMETMRTFQIDRPLLGLLLHRIQSESPPDGAFNFDESVTDFWVDGRLRDVSPKFVFIPRAIETRAGGHWDHY